MPDILFRLGPDGQPLFKEFAAAIRPTEFLPGKVFGSGTMAPIDYMVELAEGRIAPPANLDIGTIQEQELAKTLPLPYPAIPVAAGGRLEGARLYRNLDRFRQAQRALEILGRRRPRRLQELGGGHRPAQSPGRPPGASTSA